MKRILLAVLFVCFSCTGAIAAGSWTSTTATEYTGYLEGAWKPVIGFSYEFTADAADASVPDLTTIALAGALADVAVVFDGTTAPDSVTVAVKDQFGATRATGTVTATGYLDMSSPKIFIPGPLTISISGNTTNSAKARIFLVVF